MPSVALSEIGEYLRDSSRQAKQSADDRNEDLKLFEIPPKTYVGGDKHDQNSRQKKEEKVTEQHSSIHFWILCKARDQQGAIRRLVEQ